MGLGRVETQRVLKAVIEATKESKEFDAMKDKGKNTMNLIEQKQAEELLTINANIAGAHISNKDPQHIIWAVQDMED